MQVRWAQFTATLMICASLLVFTCGFDGCFNAPSGGFPLSSVDQVSMIIGSTSIPHPGAMISGSWIQDSNNNATGSVKSFPFTTTNSVGAAYISGGRVNADWYSTVNWNPICGSQKTGVDEFYGVDALSGIGWACVQSGNPIFGATSSHFALHGSLPSTITVPAQSGSPLSTGVATSLYEYDRSGALLNTLAASSVSPDGSSAVFPFPTGGSGIALPPDIYGLSMVQDSSNLTVNGISWIAIGGTDTTHLQPFGVAAIGGTLSTNQCEPVNGRRVCSPGTGTYYYPAVTLYGSSQVSVNGSLVSVGSHPTTILAYDSEAYSTKTTNGSVITYFTYTGPGRALVVNTGSNSISIIDVNRLTTLATIAVGSSPIAATISSDGSKAYVANYTAGTVSVIDLTALQLSSTITVGGNPLSLALDSSGNLWVGENNNSIKRVVLSSGTVASTTTTTGPVTSLGYSNGEAQLVATILQSDGRIQANAYSASSLQNTGGAPAPLISNPAGTSAAYAAAASNLTNLPSVQALSSATLISTDTMNSLTVSATSTGFVVTELGSNRVIMEGTTPGPVRSISVDAQDQVAYMTVPDHNLLITLPLPYIKQN